MKERDRASPTPMLRRLPIPLAALLAACAPAREPAPPQPAGIQGTGEQPADTPAPESRPSMGPRLVAEADRALLDASRARADGRNAEASLLYQRAATLYAAVAGAHDGDPALATPESLRERAAAAVAAGTEASARALASAKSAWESEFSASAPAAPLPPYGTLLEHFEQELARHPEDRGARRRLAALYLADERFPDAAALLENAADADPVFDLARAALWYRLGRNDDAVKKMEDVRLAWRRALPLRIDRPAFCLAPPRGFDRFTPSESTAFFPRQNLWVYFEAVHATCAPAGDGRWKVSLRCDYEVLDAQERAVAWPEVKDFARDYDPEPYGTVVNDVCLMLGLRLPAAPPGAYTLVLRLSDRLEGKTAEARMPFEIR